MITANTNIVNMINSPVRKIAARVELYEGSTLVDTFTYDGKLMSLTIERISEGGKFFGFGICQHVEVKILDVEREVDYITKSHSIKIAYGVNNDYTYPHPTFYITQSRRDENTNELTIYGYDLIYPAATHYTSELIYDIPYTLLDFAEACGNLLNANGVLTQRIGASETCFGISYDEGNLANLEGTESIRDVLDDIAEATQTIYFVNNEDKLVFKRLDKDAAADLELSKAKYMELETKDGRRLQTIMKTSELGDNIHASATEVGSTQYVRDNAFWDLRGDVATLVDNAVAAVGGLSIRQFTCSWRGNFLTEPGDKISLITKDGGAVITYLLNDTIEYNGGFQETTEWHYEEDEGETASNPSSLGDVLKQTYAKVDKVNKEIELVVSEVEGFDESISKLEMDTNSIQATVESTSTTLDTEISKLNTKVDAVITPEQVDIAIQKEMAKGVDKVTTVTGFTFDEEGLTISKSGSEISTQITEDGMTVSKGGEDVLIADNMGVQAIDLHAKTYLIVGTYSRFEDYGTGRTGCFWIK